MECKAFSFYAFLCALTVFRSATAENTSAVFRDEPGKLNVKDLSQSISYTVLKSNLPTILLIQDYVNRKEIMIT